ncbi:hypothetical protein [Curvivirga sp.]|uniref:ApeI family dehydratase n=1 Tax=Curvivirga sp. TaxID=2856848 RepID=UPI003B5A7CBE
MTTWQTAEINPIILKENISIDNVCLQMKASSDLFQFQGHFPEKSIFPGVGQLDWAVKFGQKYFKHNRAVIGVNQLKFKKFIEPDLQFAMSLIYLRDKNQITFKYGLIEEGLQDCFSSGVLKLSDD